MEKKHSQHKSFKFFVLQFYMEGNETHFLGSSYSEIKKLVADAVLESTKNSTKCFHAAKLRCENYWES